MAIKRNILIAFIFSAFLLKCGIPTNSSTSTFPVPVIVTGTSVKETGYDSYIYQYVTTSTADNSITLRIQSYQPYDGFDGFHVYITNNIDDTTSNSNGYGSYQTIPVNANTAHYTYNSTTGLYSNQAFIEGSYIISSSGAYSGIYPTITLSELAAIDLIEPLGLPANTKVYPEIKNQPVTFEITISYTGRGQSLIADGRVYAIGVSAANSVSKYESALSNLVIVRIQ
jgi:hypothetical protein